MVRSAAGLEKINAKCPLTIKTNARCVRNIFSELLALECIDKLARKLSEKRIEKETNEEITKHI